MLQYWTFSCTVTQRCCCVSKPAAAVVLHEDTHGKLFKRICKTYRLGVFNTHSRFKQAGYIFVKDDLR